MPTAAIVGAVVGGAASYAGARKQAKAAGKASDLQYQGQQDAIAAQERMSQASIDAQMAMQARALAAQREAYMTARADLAPFRTAGMRGLDPLAEMALGEGPNYDLTRAEGFRDIQNSAAAHAVGSAGLGSGGTLAGLVQYNNMLNETAYQQRFNNLATLASIGANAAAGQGSAAMSHGQNAASIFQNTGNNLSRIYSQQGGTLANIYTQGAAAQGNLAMQAGNAQAAGYAGIGNAVNTGITNYMISQIPGLFGGSDARLKTNVEKIGEHDGINIYEWDWNEIAQELGIDGPTIGVMAQELPDKYVHAGPQGYLMVDYAQLEADHGN